MYFILVDVRHLLKVVLSSTSTYRFKRYFICLRSWKTYLLSSYQLGNISLTCSTGTDSFCLCPWHNFVRNDMHKHDFSERSSWRNPYNHHSLKLHNVYPLPDLHKLRRVDSALLRYHLLLLQGLPHDWAGNLIPAEYSAFAL